MANRVVLDVNGLRVSRPGVNVLTAGLVDLQFNSEWAMPSVYMRGSFGSDPSADTTIYYGKTFVRRPLVTFRVNTGLLPAMVYQNDAVATNEIGGGIWDICFWSTVFADRFRARTPHGSGTVYYIVWDYDI